MSLNSEQLETFKAFPQEMRIRMLQRGFNLNLLDDVVQETYLTAHSQIERYDPDKGSFMTWLISIGYNHIRLISQAHARDEEIVNRVFQAASTHDSLYSLEINQVQMAQDMSDNLERLSTVLNIVRACVNQDYIFERSMLLMREYGGDVKLAAAKCGVKASWLRQSHQEIIELSIVVDGALKIHHRRFEENDESPVTVREILACFPSVTDKTERTWMKTIPRAIVTSGGWSLPRGELVTLVSQHTGYSPVTARHLISKCERLFTVARAVIEQGEMIGDAV